MGMGTQIAILKGIEVGVESMRVLVTGGIELAWAPKLAIPPSR